MVPAMKLTARGRYSIKAMLDLALQRGLGPCPVRAIAQRQNIPMPYLEKLLIELRRAGLVESLRGTRGGYQLAKQKIRETQLDLTWKQWSLENKLQNRLTEYNNLGQQVAFQETATDGFLKLRDMELMRFKQGESSLFIVNAREIRWLDAVSKLLALKTKRKQTRVSIDHLMGSLF